MASFTNSSRRILKVYFDKIKNEKLKEGVLQALPFWTASIITGIIAVIYTKIFSLAEKGAGYFFQLSHWLLFIITPVCFFVAIWIVKRFAPFARGSGIPQVIASIELSTPKDNHKVSRLLSLRIIVVKIVSSSILALGGGVTGREGPTIQIAGSVFRKVNSFLPAWWPKISKKNMVMTGAAAGLAAAFNTPLGGIVFAMEELTKTHISFYKTAIFSAVIIAGLTAESFLGPYLYLGYPDVSHLSVYVFFGVIIVALLSGLLASIMGKLILKMLRWKKSFNHKWKTGLFVLLCALAVAVMAFLTGAGSMNSGKELMTQLLFTSDKYVHWYTPIIRIAGSLVTFTSGASAGIFAPALCSGATIGSVLSGWMELSATNSNLLILAGMVAFLTGITRSPFTSAILVLEMTEGHNIIFHLMLAALTANLIAHFIDKHSLYDHLKDQYIKELHDEEIMSKN
jgi:H+/Cl- antiporter ClcA